MNFGPHNCTWCFKPFDDYEALKHHVQAEHKAQYDAYCEMWAALSNGDTSKVDAVVKNMFVVKALVKALDK